MSAEEFEKLNLPLEVVSNALRGNDSGLLEMVLNYVLMISSREGDEQLLQGSLITDLLDVAEKFYNETGHVALKTLVNVSGSEHGARHIFKCNEKNGSRLFGLALNPECPISNTACKVLTNLTRHQHIACSLADTIIEHPGLSMLMEAVTDKAYNKKGQRLEHLAHVVGNLAQSKEFQNYVLDPIQGQFERILPVINNSPSAVERYGVASAVFNCLFDPSTHEVLMKPPFDILPVLLLPLAGPEEFDCEDNEKLPVELQYLPDDKKREEDSSIRNLLLRALLHLCTTRPVRMEVRDRNSYLILREYHKWEKDRQNLLDAENVIDILIRTEEEIGVDNLSSLDVPEDLREKFKKMDTDFLADK